MFGNDEDILQTGMEIRYRMLASIMAIRTLSNALPDRPLVDVLNYTQTFFSHKIRRLPTFLLPRI